MQVCASVDGPNVYYNMELIGKVFAYNTTSRSVIGPAYFHEFLPNIENYEDFRGEEPITVEQDPEHQLEDESAGQKALD